MIYTIRSVISTTKCDVDVQDEILDILCRDIIDVITDEVSIMKKGKHYKQNIIIKSIKHFKTISKHKWEVGKMCFKCGLYKQGLLHDLSKFSRAEFIESVKYYQGTSSPIDAEKKDKGYSYTWLHHKGRNPHHWEYWIDNLGTRENKPAEIPYKYVVEMICDWIGAGKVYEGKNWTQKSPLNYYNRFKSERIFHPNTQKLIEKYLNDIANFGIDSFVTRVRHHKKMKELD